MAQEASANPQTVAVSLDDAGNLIDRWLEHGAKNRDLCWFKKGAGVGAEAGESLASGGPLTTQTR